MHDKVAFLVILFTTLFVYTLADELCWYSLKDVTGHIIMNDSSVQIAKGYTI